MNFPKIRAFLNVWDNAFGIPESQVKANEQNLGVGIPKVLRAYYLQLGKHPINEQQDFLLLPDEQLVYNKLKSDEDCLIFYVENQSCHHWGIKKEDVDKDNPPVYRQENDKDAEWELDTDNLQDFLWAMALWQSHFTFKNCAWVIDVLNSDIAEALQNYQKEKVHFDRWNVEFYRNNPNDLITVHRINKDYQADAYSHLYAMSNDSTNFQNILAHFNIDWDEITTEESL